jgi:SRSO17 transposase
VKTMNIARYEPRRGGIGVKDELAELSQQLFASLPRSDQRHWAEVFVRGLTTVPGRKTIAKISDRIVGGGAEQCLQQFVSQSTWPWDRVRCDLALWLTGSLEPRVWVVKDVVLPKNGSSSVGVGRQFANPAGRVLNCQLAVAIFVAGDGWSCPVNWRLVLPSAWDEDKERRKKAHLPDDEHCVPRWQLVLDAVDEMAVDWSLHPAPVYAETSQPGELDPLLCGLEERHLQYMVRVRPAEPVVLRSTTGGPRTLSFAQFIAESVSRKTSTLNMWALPAGRSGRIQLIATRLPPDAMPRSLPGRSPTVVSLRPRGPRYVVAEWSPSRRSPRAVWVTSAGPRQLPGLLADLALDRQAAADLDDLYDGLGLRHFEGRSFIGWHHHVTLVSVAGACRYASLAREGSAGEMRRGEYWPTAWD